MNVLTSCFARAALAGDGGRGDERAQLGAGVGDVRLGAVDQPAAVVLAGRRLTGPARPSPCRARCWRRRPIVSPRASGTSQRCFCASVPKSRIGAPPSETLAATVIATDESTRASSSRATRHGQRARAEPAVLLGERQAHHAQLAQLPDRRRRKRRGAIPLRRERRDLRLSKLAHGVPQRALIVGQLQSEVQHRILPASWGTTIRNPVGSPHAA